MNESELHLVNGTAGALRQALGCGLGAILVQQDQLSVGPLPGRVSLEGWRTTREQFWLSCGESLRSSDRSILENLDDLRRCESLTAWVGAGVSDQFLLPWIVKLFRLLETPLPNLSVVQFERLPGKTIDIMGLGIVDVDELKNHGGRERVAELGIAELERVWAVLTAPSPDDLLKEIGREPVMFPLLRRALRTTLDRFPDLKTGLSYWDRELLRCTRASGPKAVRVMGSLLTRSLQGNYPDLGLDLYLFDRLRRLGAPGLAEPAVSFKGDRSSYSDCEVRLTGVGEAFLKGKRNFVEVNGTDEWVAGVHLDSKTGQVWFRNGNELVPTSAA